MIMVLIRSLGYLFIYLFIFLRRWVFMEYRVNKEKRNRWVGKKGGCMRESKIKFKVILGIIRVN